MLSVFGCFVGAILLFLAANGDKEDEISRVHTGVGVIMTLVAGAQTFFLYAVLRCYFYLKEKSKMV